MSKPVIVIVPGIGDELGIYSLFAAKWRHRGYEAHIIPFGWFEHSARLQPKLEAFYKRLDALDSKHMHLIGVSAGGPAAIIAMAERQDVHKVITVSAPLDTLPGLRNRLLKEAIDRTRQYLQTFSISQKQRILSVRALHDPVVDPKLSQPEGVQTVRVAMVFHPSAIFVAMMFYTRRLHHFLKM
jgi:alpha-beta hydrolase superfamily lysophospholipase